MELMTMESLFAKAGLNWKTMEKNVPYDVSDRNILIKSYNHETKQNEMKKILHLVRKDDTDLYKLVSKSGDILLKCSGAHRIWDANSNQYHHVQDIEGGHALSKTGELIEFFVQKTRETTPIVDMEVEGNSNYFTNGLLSHNTVTGGKALEYYASVRLRVSQCGKVEETIDGEKVVKAIETRVTSSKNKTYAPFKTCEIVVEFGKGIDNDAGVLDLAFQYGIIKKGGGGIYTVNGEKFKGLPALKEYLESNPELYEDIKVKTREAMDNDKQEAVEEEAIDADSMTDDEIAEAAESNDDAEVGEV